MGGVLVRWATALTSVVCGWLTGFLAYLAIANGSPHDQMVWGIWTAGFCLLAWLMIGLPLAAGDPDLTSPPRIAIAVISCGFIGILMVFLFFRGLSPAIAALAFLTAAASMLIYTLLLRAFTNR